MNLYFNNVNTGNTDWNDSNNWFTLPGGTGSNQSPNIGDTLYFETNCDFNIPSQLDYYIYVQSGATLTINTTVYNNTGYSITVDAGGTLNLSDSATLDIITVDSVINITGVLNCNYFVLTNSNASICNVSATGTAYLNAGVLQPASIVNVSGLLYFYNFTIQSTINVTSNATVYFTTTTVNTTPNLSGSNSTLYFSTQSIITTQITVPANTFFVATGGAALNANASVINYGTATLNSFTGSGTFTNNNVCTISNVVSVSTLINNGSLIISGTGTLGTATFTNNGTTDVNASGTLIVTPTSVFTNNGTFNFGSLYTTKFKGRIFPQVPSSASWGNALL